MFINLWRKFPKRKPRKDGYYLVTIYSLEEDFSYVARLYYDARAGKWENNERKHVFAGYVVYRQCRAPIEDNRVYWDSLCDRTEEVVAWKKLPRAKEFKRKIEE